MSDHREYTADCARPVRVDPLVMWAVSGFAGVLRVLRDQCEHEVRLPQQAVADLLLIQDQIDYILCVGSGRCAERPSLGGASGALARHLS